MAYGVLRSGPSSKSFGLCCVHRLQLLHHSLRTTNTCHQSFGNVLFLKHTDIHIDTELISCANQYALRCDKVYLQNSQTTTPKSHISHHDYRKLCSYFDGMTYTYFKDWPPKGSATSHSSRRCPAVIDIST